MAKGYIVGLIRVHDKEGFQKFSQVAGPVLEEHGGKILVRNPNPEVREGNDLGMVLILEFESIEKARGFYESEKYQAAIAMREKAADTNLYLAEGL
jgi:uncharacterized protein (DUF1330 family)